MDLEESKQHLLALRNVSKVVQAKREFNELQAAREYFDSIMIEFKHHCVLETERESTMTAQIESLQAELKSTKKQMWENGTALDELLEMIDWFLSTRHPLFTLASVLNEFRKAKGQ